MRPANVAALTVDELAAAHRLLDDLQDENERLLAEAVALNVLSFVGGSLVGLDDRGASVVGLIEQIDRFVGTTFPRVEDLALAGDETAAFRLRRATQNILAAVQGVSPIDEGIDDVRKTVRDAASDLDSLVRTVLLVAGGAVVGGLVGTLAGGGGYTFLGASLGAGLGFVVRALTK